MLLILGVAGSGKSTQSNLLATQEGMVALSVGELLRKTTPAEMQQKMLTGALLDDDYVITTVNDELRRLSGAGEVILDGFPRTTKQAQWLLEQKNQHKYDLNIDEILYRSTVLCYITSTTTTTTTATMA